MESDVFFFSWSHEPLTYCRTTKGTHKHTTQKKKKNIRLTTRPRSLAPSASSAPSERQSVQVPELRFVIVIAVDKLFLLSHFFCRYVLGHHNHPLLLHSPIFEVIGCTYSYFLYSDSLLGVPAIQGSQTSLCDVQLQLQVWRQSVGGFVTARGR